MKGEKKMKREDLLKIDRETVRNKSMVLINDSFQNFKQYNLPKAQLVIADIPYSTFYR